MDLQYSARIFVYNGIFHRAGELDGNGGVRLLSVTSGASAVPGVTSNSKGNSDNRPGAGVKNTVSPPSSESIEPVVDRGLGSSGGDSDLVGNTGVACSDRVGITGVE